MKRLASEVQASAKKRAKLASTSSSQSSEKFTNAEAIQTVLQAHDSDILIQGIIACMQLRIIIDTVIFQG
jgi:hypothetical protein